MAETWFIFLIILLFTLPIKGNNSKKKYDEEQSHRSSFLSSDGCSEEDKKKQTIQKLDNKLISNGEVCPKKEGKK